MTEPATVCCERINCLSRKVIAFDECFYRRRECVPPYRCAEYYSVVLRQVNVYRLYRGLVAVSYLVLTLIDNGIVIALVRRDCINDSSVGI